MKRESFFILILFFLCIRVVGQKQFSLEECIDIAKRNSNMTKLAAINQRDAMIDVMSAQQNKIPSASAGIGHGLNFGRNIDPSSNTFINEQITRGGFNGQGYLPIWQANQLNNTLKQAKYADTAARWSIKNEEYSIQLNITLAYLSLLNNKELGVRAEAQEKTTIAQLERLKNLNNQGAIVPSVLSDMEGQLASDQLNTLSSKQEIKNAKLRLCQLMNIPFDASIDVKPENIIMVEPGVNDLDATLIQHPMIKYREFQTKSAELGLAAAKSARYPQLGFSVNLGSNYSSAFVLNNEKVGYPKQLSNNFNYSGLLSLSIPILDGYRVRSNIKRAENAIDRAKTNTDLAKNVIQQQVEEAQFLQDGAKERYILSESQLKSFEKSFKIAEIRFNNGTSNSIVEYIIAKNNYDRAQNLVITTKYELAFRNRMLDFYANMR